MTEKRSPSNEVNPRRHPTTKALGLSVVSFETDGPAPYDGFGDMLPLMLGATEPAGREPRFDELPAGKTHRQYLKKIEERERLANEGLVTTGNGLVILHSDIGEKSTMIERKGKMIEVSDYFHSEAEGREHRDAAESLRHTIVNTMGHPSENVVLRVATREALDEAILDPRVGHILYIGHANRSQLAIDPVYTYNWHETPELTHLKKSFGVFGCGTLKNNRYFPRIGSTFVAPDGLLYGVPGDYLEEGQPYTFDQLAPYSLDILEGTPLPGDNIGEVVA